jgi:hypothetical protein
VYVQLSEDLRGIQEMLVLIYPVPNTLATPSQHTTISAHIQHSSERLANSLGRSISWGICEYVLIPIPSHQRQIQHQRQPISIYEEERSEKGVDAGFRDDVHVEAVAEVDGVDVVAFQVAVHDGEEDLQEEVDCVEQDC